MDAVEAVVVGAGLRGRHTYGAYARAYPERLRVVAVAEPDPGRREAMAREHDLPREACFAGWKELLDGPRRAPVAIVATPDTLHVEPALTALGRGYQLLLEKPIAPAPADCLRVVAEARRRGRILQIGHVLRYTPFYGAVHALVAEGRIGRLLHLEMQEHVAAWHFTHSFVRGKFRNRARAAPLILAKCCHDLDLLCWIAGARPTRVRSSGGLVHYHAGRAPEGAPARCTDGCPVQGRCPHDAERFYLGPDDAVARIFPWSDLSLDGSRASRRHALETGPYGRCVYRCDNDLVDRQVCDVEFEGGLTARFAVNGHAVHETRTIRATGSEGVLRGDLHAGVIEVARHDRMDAERHAVGGSALGHYGGDHGLLDHFTKVVARGEPDAVRASGEVSLESHLLGFASEASRLEGVSVDLGDWRLRVEREAAAPR